jgi:predicted RNA-binding protein YlqC (UPF0109 family)
MTNDRESIRLWLETTIKELVDCPELVGVKIHQGDRTTVFLVRTATKDVGKIIGKQGRIAAALRVILNSISVKYGFRCVMEILEWSNIQKWETKF